MFTAAGLMDKLVSTGMARLGLFAKLMKETQAA
jgi:hypothetical protein